MSMAHARAPALATHTGLLKLPCELLMCQCSALRCAQGNFCGSNAAGSMRDEIEGTLYEHSICHAHCTRARSRTRRDHERLRCMCDHTCAYAYAYVHEQNLGRHRGVILGPSECISHWQHEYASRDHTLLRGPVPVRIDYFSGLKMIDSPPHQLPVIIPKGCSVGPPSLRHGWSKVWLY